MRILIAPDKFKGSLSAGEVAQNIAAGLREVLPDAKIEICPLADGGEGTAEVIARALGGSWMECEAHDPLGRKIVARYAWIEKNKLAVMEMSEVAGMRRLKQRKPVEKLDGLKPSSFEAAANGVDYRSTFGVGEMILAATKNGARKIIVGLGGSATNDGGFGMARALGFRFFDSRGNEIQKFLDLSLLEEISPSPQSSPSGRGSREVTGEGESILLPKIIAAVDVRNPLLGGNGATRVFGPQKGVTPDKIEKFERALNQLADVAAQTFGKDFRNEPGAGAAGGLGFGLMNFCGAKIKPGFDVVAEAVGLESKIRNVDLVVTGEGSLDRQTLEGKTPAGVARLAKKFGKRAFAIVGVVKQDRDVCELFERVYELGGTIPQATELLRERARELAKDL